MIPRQRDVHSILVYFPGATLQVKGLSSALIVKRPPSSPRKENPSHSARHPSILTLSYTCPLYRVSSSLLFPISPLPFFTSPTLAVFHLNISSSCLAASAACQVSSRSQGPTLKWSMEVIFRGVCVRRQKDGGGGEKKKEKGWVEKERQLDQTQTSGGDRK